MKRSLLVLWCLVVVVGSIRAASASTSDWTAWIMTNVDDQPTSLAISSSGEVVAEIAPPIPHGYERGGMRAVSASGRYVAYSVYAGDIYQPSSVGVTVYDTETDDIIFTYQIIDEYFWDNGTAVFSEEETLFAFSYSLYSPDLTVLAGWRLLVFDLETGTIAHELAPDDDDDEATPSCLGCTPLVQRFVRGEVTFQLTNLQIEDFARPYVWDLSSDTFVHDPGYDYFYFDIFLPTDEVIYARYDARFAPADQSLLTDGPPDYFYTPNTLWVSGPSRRGEFPFYTRLGWFASRPTFIQNGERVLLGASLIGGQSSDYQLLVINRDGTSVDEYEPLNHDPWDAVFANTPDGFIHLDPESSTLWHVNTRQQPFQVTEVWSSGKWGTLSHIQYDIQPGQWSAWRQLAD
jgi:hypothetical protein